MRSVSDFSCREKYRTVCVIVWKNTVKPDRPQVTVWRMRISRGVSKATNTLSEYVILIAFILQQWFTNAP